MRQAPRVFALVVTFNAPLPELVKCVSAIQSQSMLPTEVLVVDNHGDQPLPGDELGALGASPLRLLRTDENLGPPGGYAAGIEVFLRTDCTHLWMLDDDVVADPDCLAQLFALLASDDREVLAMPRAIDTRDGSVYDDVTTWWGALIPRRAIDVCGVPRTDLFYSLDDQEYFHDRFPLGGFPVIRTTTAIVRLLQREPTSVAPWKLYYIVRNAVYRYLWDRRHVPLSTRVKSLLRGLWLWWRWSWQDPDTRWAKLGYYCRGVLDGLLGRLGKRVIPSSADRSWSVVHD